MFRDNNRWMLGLLALGLSGVLVMAGSYWWFSRADQRKERAGGGVQTLSPREVEIGRRVYQTNCAVCHGERAEGAANWREKNPDDTYPPPPHDASGHTWHHGDGTLYRIVRDGGVIFESPGFKSAMPAFRDQLSPEEVRAAIVYLKSLWGPEERGFQVEVSREDPFPLKDGDP